VTTPALVLERLWRADDLDDVTVRAIGNGLDGDCDALTAALAALLAARIRIPIHDDRDDIRTLYLALLAPMTTEEADDAWCELTRVDWGSRQPMTTDRLWVAHVPAAAAAWDALAAERAALAADVPVMTAALARKVVDLRARSTAA
jgi:hypothetical protein